ncbi:MAG: Iron-sulfur cluster assembly scaffold protein IscU 2 [Candidatus Methanophagaceae archaeon]|jgi:nitrogen fixation NifU-like protein|nr:MAG: Iron-sulfur cluster assembly scaffold protein IscU 2 [Methanophagales archaeon]KAF5436144.1 nitrogen fixation protein NifU [Methanophagales archaeon]
MSEMQDLLKESGYSEKAIEYYMNKVNVGELSEPDAHAIYTGPCGDTMEIFLNVEDGVIKEAKFQAIGCAGAFSSGSALTERIIGMTLEEVEKIEEDEIIDYLGGIPAQKVHCTCLSKRTLQKAIKNYKERRN